MIYLDRFGHLDSNAFSLKWNVPIKETPCRKCGILVAVNIPIISKDWVGFQSNPHECGERYIVTRVKSRSPVGLDYVSVPEEE